MVTKKKQTKKVSKKQSTKAASTSKSSSSKSTVKDGLACAILQYFFPIGQIWYLVDDSMKENAFAKFHLKQSLVLLVAYVANIILGFIIPFLSALISIVLLVLWIVGLVYAIQGKTKNIPIIGQFERNFKF